MAFVKFRISIHFYTQRQSISERRDEPAMSRQWQRRQKTTTITGNSCRDVSDCEWL